ncbi:hypothetical protein SFRURICE_018891 [Spodoptera frugiperda]|nr:hypothetical protein SFRURICE_018891 [Spodoptera frugiperda]
MCRRERSMEVLRQVLTFQCLILMYSFIRPLDLGRSSMGKIMKVSVSPRGPYVLENICSSNPKFFRNSGSEFNPPAMKSSSMSGHALGLNLSFKFIKIRLSHPPGTDTGPVCDDIHSSIKSTLFNMDADEKLEFCFCTVNCTPPAAI